MYSIAKIDENKDFLQFVANMSEKHTTFAADFKN